MFHNGALVDSSNLVWDERSAKREEHPGCANHLTDAALYAWRHCYAYLAEALERPPAYGTQEWFDREEESMLQAALRQAEERNLAAKEEDWLFGPPEWI